MRSVENVINISGVFLGIRRLRKRAKLSRATSVKRDLPYKQNLKLHKVVHSGEKPFKCGHCDMSFTKKQILLGRIGTYTGAKPYQCSYCFKEFGKATHQSTHKGTSLRV